MLDFIVLLKGGTMQMKCQKTFQEFWELLQVLRLAGSSDRFCSQLHPHKSSVTLLNEILPPNLHRCHLSLQRPD